MRIIFLLNKIDLVITTPWKILKNNSQIWSQTQSHSLIRLSEFPHDDKFRLLNSGLRDGFCSRVFNLNAIENQRLLL